MFNLLKSLLLSLLFSFASPLVLIGGVLALLSGLSHVPGLGEMAITGNRGILDFLAVFGNGYPILGLLTIGLACSLVGGLLELFNIFQQGIRFHVYAKKGTETQNRY